MRHQFNRQVIILSLALGIGLQLASCSDSQFGSGGVGGPLEKSSRKEKSSEGESLGNASDEEDESANEPAQISGAYLTCETVAGPAADQASTAVGCNIMTKDGKAMDLSAFLVTYVVEDAAQKDIGCLFTGPKDGYQTMTDVPSGQVSEVTVIARVDNKGEVTTLKSKVNEPANPAQTPDDPGIPGQTVFGKATDFHLGDGDFSSSANSDCTQPLQPKDAAGQKLLIPFEVKSDSAKLSAELSEICGLDDDDSFIIITGNNLSMKRIEIADKAKSASMPQVTLAKGSYTFEIHAESILGNIDDFLVGQITFQAEGDLTLGKPVGSN